MKTGKTIGLFCGITGLLMAAYFSLLPLIAGTLTESLSPYQVGIYGAAIGALLGLSSALMGVIARRYQ